MSSTRLTKGSKREELTSDVLKWSGEVDTVPLTRISGSDDDLDVWKDGERRENSSDLRATNEKRRKGSAKA